MQLAGHERGEKVHMRNTISIFIPMGAQCWGNKAPMNKILRIRGGKWQPDAGHLARIRHTIDRRPNKFKKPLQKPQFKKLFGGEKGLLQWEDKLKTTPKVRDIVSRRVVDDRDMRRIIRILSC